MKKRFGKNLTIIVGIGMIVFFVFMIFPSERVDALSYDGEDLALTVLADNSTLISSSYTDRDRDGYDQSTISSSLGTMAPTDGDTFIILSTGVAGAVPVTTYESNPGAERGTWFKNQWGHPRDSATLTLVLDVPEHMHYLYYDFQFFSAEYPEYIGTQFNDKFTVTVDSPSKGMTTYFTDVNSGNFVLDSNYIPGTGFDIFALDGNPSYHDTVDTTPRTPGADAGATALVTVGGEYHSVSPNEQITVTFDIRDIGDNLFDSAVFIDNVMFAGYAITDIVSRKTIEDLNGGDLECSDTVEYTVSITNVGGINQSDNPGNEFEDYIPNNTAYVNGSITATSGIIGYDDVNNKIIWNGNIPSESSVVLTFQVTVDQGLENGTVVSNQGTVYYDSNENGTNEATELTDNPYVDDGIDLDGDGQTDDDDPTTMAVISFEPPSTVTEDFSDDSAGEGASQLYFGQKWFETSNGSIGSNFEVAPSYYYSTANSFKTKLRSQGSPQNWNYILSELSSDIIWWEIWFSCGNASETADLYLNFKNGNEQNIARIKFEYAQEGAQPPMDWVLKLYYWSPVNGWVRLNSDFQGGYLYYSWYKLRIERNGLSYINYSLYRADENLADSETDSILGPSFSDLASIEWRSTKNPVACPIFFWDEHRLGLTPKI